MSKQSNKLGLRFFFNLIRWFDAEASVESSGGDNPHRINWLRCMPFIFIHIACIGAIWTGWSVTALIACLFFFWLRMFAITAFYHRLFCGNHLCL